MIGFLFLISEKKSQHKKNMNKKIQAYAYSTYFYLKDIQVIGDGSPPMGMYGGWYSIWD